MCCRGLWWASKIKKTADQYHIRDRFSGQNRNWKCSFERYWHRIYRISGLTRSNASSTLVPTGIKLDESEVDERLLAGLGMPQYTILPAIYPEAE